jgi:uncharacterized membrane protein
MDPFDRFFSSWHDSAIATLIGAIITFIGSLVGIWFKDRNLDQRHVQYLDKASKFLAFWEQHHKLQQLITADSDSEGRAKLQGKLDAAAEFVDISVSLRRHRAPEERTQLQPQSWLRRWLLLYKPVQWWAWLPRVYFYYFALVLLLCPILIISSAFESDVAGLGFGFGGLVLGGPVALVFRMLSRMIEGPRPLTASDVLFAKHRSPTTK